MSLRIAIGVDVSDLERWRRLWRQGRLAPGAPLARLFTPAEHAHCRARPEPELHYAVRWCAREAAVKAARRFWRLGVRSVSVALAADGRPHLHWHRPWPAHLRLLDADLSLAHDRGAAIAVVSLLVEVRR